MNTKSIIAVAAAIILSGAALSAQSQSFKLGQWTEIQNSILKELNRSYVDSLPVDRIERAGINAMLDALDPYTIYIPEEENEDLQMMVSKSYGGIGAVIYKPDQNGNVIINEPYKNSPAERYGLRILIDLHTVPGGQNGYDNGGIVGVCRWHRNDDDVEYVLSVLERLGKRYGKRDGLFGIEVVNEPISHIVWRFAESTRMAVDPEEAAGSEAVPTEFLRAFYRRAYARLRAVLPEDKAVVFHDGFRYGPWRLFFRREKMKNVYLDMHPYIWAMEMFVPFHRPWAYRVYLAFQRARIRKLQRFIPVLIGEWCVCNHWTHDLPGFRKFGKRHRKLEPAGNPGVNAAARALEKAEYEAEKLRRDTKREAEKLRQEAEKLLGMETFGQEAFGRKKESVHPELPEGTAAERRRRVREVAKLELASWREAAGWCYWSWKLDPESVYSGAAFWKAGWDLRWCLGHGWMPKHAGRF